ncbi:MAG: alpha/beta hydrolase [Phycisphaerales bacterium]|nr:MAG: alpha/beta hydrolase [Phycisphaerales bacterium]
MNKDHSMTNPARTARPFELLQRVLPLLAAALFAFACSPPALADAPGIGHVETMGEGEKTLILVPGLGCDWTVWRAFMERNKDRYTMHAITLAGFGDTPPPADPGHDEGTPWLDGAIAAIGAHIDAHGLDRPILVGHSLGGHLALRFAAERPGVLGGAVCVDGLPVFPLGIPIPADQREAFVNQNIAPQLRGMSDEMWAMQQRQSVEGMVRDEARRAELAAMILEPSREVTVRYLLELFKSDIVADLAQIADPALLIGAVPGENVPGAAQIAAMMREVWRDSEKASAHLRVVTLKNTGHFVMDDAPDRLDAMVRAFVAGEDVRPLGDDAR